MLIKLKYICTLVFAIIVQHGAYADYHIAMENSTDRELQVHFPNSQVLVLKPHQIKNVYSYSDCSINLLNLKNHVKEGIINKRTMILDYRFRVVRKKTGKKTIRISEAVNSYNQIQKPKVDTLQSIAVNALIEREISFPPEQHPAVEKLMFIAQEACKRKLCINDENTTVKKFAGRALICGKQPWDRLMRKIDGKAKITFRETGDNDIELVIKGNGLRTIY